MVLKNIIRIIKLFPKKRLLILGVIITILLSIIQVLLSLYIKEILDAAIKKDYNLFISSLYFLSAFVFINLAGTYFKTRFIGNYTEGGLSKLRNKVATKILNIPFSKYGEMHTGEYLSRTTNDITKIKNFTIQTLPDLIRVPLTAIGALIALIIISWKLTLLSLILIPILFIGSSLLSKPIESLSKKQQQKLAKVNIIASDYIKGVEVAKSYNLEDVIGTKFINTVDESVKHGKDLASRNAYLNAFARVLSILPFFITFFMGGYWTIQGDMTIGGLLAFINLLNNVTFPISYLPMLYSHSKNDLVSVNRIYEILDLEEERVDGEIYNIASNTPFIEFKNVKFRYQNQNDYLLSNLNFVINEHDKVAFVGPSGSGKSTIFKLLLGYYEDYEGQILIYGHDIKKWKLNGLKDQFAFVFQDTYLFPESIFENISYGNLNANNEMIIKSAVLANAHNFITSLPQGYDTMVAELGSSLSGGQKQRIAIARAILKDAPILLLDEATSALDNESEALIQEALTKLLVDKTSIIVAHRLSTIKNVDKIFVINNGQIVEEGTHHELLANNGLYSELYKIHLDNNNKKVGAYNG